MRRLLVVDQHQGDIYLLAVHTKACRCCSSLAHSWLQQTVAAVQALKAGADADSNGHGQSIAGNGWRGTELPDKIHTGQAVAMKASCEACQGYVESSCCKSVPAEVHQHDCAGGQQSKVG